MLQRAIDTASHHGSAIMPEGGPLVRLSGVAKDYNGFQAVHPLDLSIAWGDFVSILGPSGCGKTTLLRMLGGFVTPSQGMIEVDGRDVTALPPESAKPTWSSRAMGCFRI